MRVKRWALVTGASAGIGAAFARLLAGKQYNVVLIARREDKLATLAAELKAADVDTLCLPADLELITAPAEICAQLAQHNIQIDFLVNNAGYGLPGKFHESDWATHARYNNLMVGAVCELTHRLLPAMRKHQSGRIVNVASVAGIAPGTAGHTLYAASKAYLIKFSESLHFENAEANVHVTALCPGFTYSEFHDVTGTRNLVERLPGILWLTAEYVAAAGYSAVSNGNPVVVPGIWYKFLVRLVRYLPQGLLYRIMRSQSSRFRNPY